MPRDDYDPTDHGLNPEPVEQVHECRDGWLGSEDAPAPCPVCRPKTAERLARQRQRWSQ